MDRFAFWSILTIVVALAMAAGGWRWGWRGPLVVLFAVVAIVSALVTVFFLYVGIASPGSRTLLFFVLPAAAFAWVGFALARAVWNLPSPAE